jgi:hypothetical protein
MAGRRDGRIFAALFSFLPDGIDGQLRFDVPQIHDVDNGLFKSSMTQ